VTVFRAISRKSVYFCVAHLRDALNHHMCVCGDVTENFADKACSSGHLYHAACAQECLHMPCLEKIEEEKAWKEVEHEQNEGTVVCQINKTENISKNSILDGTDFRYSVKQSHVFNCFNCDMPVRYWFGMNDLPLSKELCNCTNTNQKFSSNFDCTLIAKEEINDLKQVIFRNTKYQSCKCNRSNNFYRSGCKWVPSLKTDENKEKKDRGEKS
jgi:hypothetical protein